MSRKVLPRTFLLLLLTFFGKADELLFAQAPSFRYGYVVRSDSGQEEPKLVDPSIGLFSPTTEILPIDEGGLLQVEMQAPMDNGLTSSSKNHPRVIDMFF
jgi:hypothetical protein